jgi:hypothetical protein
MTGVSHVYRIFHHQETAVTTKEKILIQYSHSNYQIMLKFQSPPHLSRYGVDIYYNSTKMF